MFRKGGPSLGELAKQAWSSTDRGYDLLAPKFELTPFCTPKEVLDVVGEQIGSASRGLDLCCGTGAGARMLQQVCKDQVIGIDRSEGMLQQARLLSASASVPTRFLQGDALNSPFEDKSYDVITCFGAFGHIQQHDEPRFIVEIARLLTPGGRFVFVTSRMPRQLSRAWLMARGFNAAMRVRNLIRKPEFIMYYLTFLYPHVRPLLENAGLEVTADEHVFAAPYHRLLCVTARKSA